MFCMWLVIIIILDEFNNPSKIMIITSHMQKIIQIYLCLLKLLRKQDIMLNIGDFSIIILDGF
jgi:uncharacterized protein YggT (Ycf19 family)